MGSLDNLKMFSSTYQPKKNGRPKGSKSISTILKKMLEGEIDYIEPKTGEKKKRSVKEQIAAKLIEKAMRGEDKAMDTIIDRLEGKAPQVIENYEMPVTSEQAFTELQKVADIEGISLKELCEREGIEYEHE